MDENELRGNEAIERASRLTKVATNRDGWEVIYFDPATAERWVLDYPESHLHGGGSPRLRRLPGETEPRLAHVNAAVEVLREALAGRTSPVVASRWVVGHRAHLGLEESDRAFLRLVGFCSETDDLDVDDALRAQWNPAALAVKDRELEERLGRLTWWRDAFQQMIAQLRP